MAKIKTFDNTLCETDAHALLMQVEMVQLKGGNLAISSDIKSAFDLTTSKNLNDGKIPTSEKWCIDAYEIS